MESEYKNPADKMDGKIADSHRQIAKEFIETLTKDEALKLFAYFDRDVYQMQRHFTDKLGAYYMLWTPRDKRNVFIGEWLVAEICKKATE